MLRKNRYIGNVHDFLVPLKLLFSISLTKIFWGKILDLTSTAEKKEGKNLIYTDFIV